MHPLLLQHFVVTSWAVYSFLLLFLFYIREVYHCPFCNLCRVGKGLGTDFFHCMTCNCCLGIKSPDHKCWEKGLEINCPICCDFLFTSSATVKALPCGHYMHSDCFRVGSSSISLPWFQSHVYSIFSNFWKTISNMVDTKLC